MSPTQFRDLDDPAIFVCNNQEAVASFLRSNEALSVMLAPDQGPGVAPAVVYRSVTGSSVPGMDLLLVVRQCDEEGNPYLSTVFIDEFIRKRVNLSGVIAEASRLVGIRKELLERDLLVRTAESLQSMGCRHMAFTTHYQFRKGLQYLSFTPRFS